VPGDGLRERGGKAGDRVGFASPLARELLRLEHAPPGGDEESPLPPAGKHDERGDRRRRSNGEDDPGVDVAEDVVLLHPENPEEHGEAGDEGEKEPDAQAEPRRPPLAGERHGERERHERVQARDGEERDGVGEDGLQVVVHRAQVMIGSGEVPRDPRGAMFPRVAQGERCLQRWAERPIGMASPPR
jgi:hypothetical protein